MQYNSIFEKMNISNNKPLQKYRTNKFESFLQIPMPTWKRLKFKDYELPEFREYDEKFISNNISNLQDGVVVKPITDNVDEKYISYFDTQNPFGVHNKFVTLGESLYNSGILAHIPKNTKVEEIIKVTYVLNSQNPFVNDHNIIVAEANSQGTIIFDYTTNDNSNTFHNGVTKVYAKDGAVLNIIKVQRMNDVSNHFDSNVAFVGRNAKVNWITVEIGCEVGTSSYVTYLNEPESESDLKSIYFTDGKRKSDLEYTMKHIGMRSISNIESRGALKDKAHKIFRGNLDFKKGSKRSSGVEEEYVILLDPTVKSDSIPALLCGEDDVNGQHAASAGQIDADKLFYLMSRGMSEKEAKKLIVEASFIHIIDNIPELELRNAIDGEIRRRLIHV